MATSNPDLEPYGQTLTQVANGYRYETAQEFTDEGLWEDGETSWVAVDEYSMGDYTETHICTGDAWVTHAEWNTLTAEQVSEMKKAARARVLKIIAEMDAKYGKA